MFGVNLNFNLNKTLEDKRKDLTHRLQSVCPHVLIFMEGDRILGQSLFNKPPMTFDMYCRQCGLTAPYDEWGIAQQVRYYLANPRQYFSDLKKFDRIARKLE